MLGVLEGVLEGVFDGVTVTLGVAVADGVGATITVVSRTKLQSKV